MDKLGIIKSKIKDMRSTSIHVNGKKTTVGKKASSNVRDLKVKNSVLALINTILVMRTKWYETAKPRIEAFEKTYSNIRKLQDLESLLDSMSEKEFCDKVLDFRSHPRYVKLRKMTKAFADYQKEKGFSNDWKAMPIPNPQSIQ